LEKTSQFSQLRLFQRVLVRLKGQLRLSLVVVGLTTPVLIYFLIRSGWSSGWLETAYIIASLGYFWLPLLFLPYLMLPFYLFKWTKFLITILYWLWFVFLVTDLFVFQLYSYHIEAEVLWIVALDFSGLGAPLFLKILTALVAIGLLSLLGWLQFRLEKMVGRRSILAIHGFGLALSLVLFAGSSIVHIWASTNSREEILRYDSFLPLYKPITSQKLAPKLSAWLPAIFPAGLATSGAAPKTGRGGIVHYPLQTPRFRPERLLNAEFAADPTLTSQGASQGASKASILLIVLESWRSSAMSQAITPHLWEFSTKATRFERHISSGSSTVPGIFGLLYGVHPTIYKDLRNVPVSHPSLLTETLAAQGYQVKVFTGNRFDRFQLKTLLFPRVGADNFHEGDDQTLVDGYLASLGEGGEPRFDFLFLIASHSPYNYPPQAAKFSPVPAVKGSQVLNRDTDPRPHLNAYHNSLYYLDSLVGPIFDQLAAMGRLDNMWVIVTGDHAEEFNDNGLGYWGHGGNFSQFQTRTPLIVKRPGQKAGRIESRVSIHQDLVPTLMEEELGCLTERANYSDGLNLFTLPEGERSTIVSSYFDSAYIMGDTVLEKLRVKRYSWTNMSPLKSSPTESERLSALYAAERRFYAQPGGGK
jgi:membrane-anchored protein YejM (alkaline phosphatase superfamily)